MNHLRAATSAAILRIRDRLFDGYIEGPELILAAPAGPRTVKLSDAVVGCSCRERMDVLILGSRRQLSTTTTSSRTTRATPAFRATRSLQLSVVISDLTGVIGRAGGPTTRG